MTGHHTDMLGLLVQIGAVPAPSIASTLPDELCRHLQRDVADHAHGVR